MNLPKYVYKRLSIKEKLKLFLYRRRAKIAMKKMDVCIKNAYMYEDLMYKKDDELVNYIHILSLKHA
jgi:hypothetical protein